MSDNPLRRWFEANTGRLIHKLDHYFEIYHRHFARYRDARPTVVEFGVSQGGSLEMWRDYFGPGARIVGVDINPACDNFGEGEGIEVFVGDQADRGFLREFAVEVGPIDVLVDDGGHTMEQLTTTFEEMYAAVAVPGVYLAEDLQTCYWEKYGGGVRRDGSFIEYAKGLVDRLNAWSVGDRKKTPPYDGPTIEVDAFTRTTDSLSFYNGVLVIEKRDVPEPEVRKTGHYVFAEGRRSKRALGG